MTEPSKGPRTLYVAGPMQGIPEFNFPLFNAVTKVLRAGGHTVFNPAEKDIERLDGKDLSKGNLTGDIAEANKMGFSLRQALAEDTQFIALQANAIVMLPGWEKSNGAQAEHRLAVALISEGMEIKYLSPLEAARVVRQAEYLAAQAAEESANAG